MSNQAPFRYETLQLHTGQEVDSTSGLRTAPIYQTTFEQAFRQIENAAREPQLV